FIIFDNEDRLVEALRKEFPESMKSAPNWIPRTSRGTTGLIHQVKSEESYQFINDKTYQINPDHAEDYVALIKHIKEHSTLPSTIIYRLSLSHGTEISDKLIKEQLKRSYFALFYLAQALMQ